MHEPAAQYYKLFQSTPPARGATAFRGYVCHQEADFNPRPPRGGRLDGLTGVYNPTAISIHAPREGGDGFDGSDIGTILFISIHAPREGGDCGRGGTSSILSRFQSTPPARGATEAVVGCPVQISHFNPRPPRGGRRGAWVFQQAGSRFQSTPPARGATGAGRHFRIHSRSFQSTPPARGATPPFLPIR